MLKPSAEKYIWELISSLALLALMWKYECGNWRGLIFKPCVAVALVVAAAVNCSKQYSRRCEPASLSLTDQSQPAMLCFLKCPSLLQAHADMQTQPCIHTYTISGKYNLELEQMACNKHLCKMCFHEQSMTFGLVCVQCECGLQLYECLDVWICMQKILYYIHVSM